MNDIRASNYVRRINLVLKHLYDRTMTNLLSLANDDTVKTGADAISVFLANAGTLSGMFNKPSRELDQQARSYLEALPSGERDRILSKLEYDRSLLVDASAVWRTKIKYLTFAGQNNDIEVLALKLAPQWDEEKHIAPFFNLTAEGDFGYTGARIRLIHSKGAHYDGNEISIEDALQHKPFFAHRYTVQTETPYHLFCYSESLNCNARRVFLPAECHKPIIGPWQPWRT